MARAKATDCEVLSQITKARVSATMAKRTEPHAASARYEPQSRMLHISFTNGAQLSVPIAIIPDLATASDSQLAEVQVGASGVALHWETLDADLTVAGMARLALGTNTLLRAAGAAGGSATSKAKAAAARRNGMKGGRPRAIAGTSSAKPSSRARAARKKKSRTHSILLDE